MATSKKQIVKTVLVDNRMKKYSGVHRDAMTTYYQTCGLDLLHLQGLQIRAYHEAIEQDLDKVKVEAQNALRKRMIEIENDPMFSQAPPFANVAQEPLTALMQVALQTEHRTLKNIVEQLNQLIK